MSSLNTEDNRDIPSADDDIGAFPQCLSYTEAAQIRLRAYGLVSPFVQWFPISQTLEDMAFSNHPLERLRNIIPLNPRHFYITVSLLQQHVFDNLSQQLCVARPCVDGKPRPIPRDVVYSRLEALQKRAGKHARSLPLFKRGVWVGGCLSGFTRAVACHDILREPVADDGVNGRITGEAGYGGHAIGEASRGAANADWASNGGCHGVEDVDEGYGEKKDVDWYLRSWSTS